MGPSQQAPEAESARVEHDYPRTSERVHRTRRWMVALQLRADDWCKMREWWLAWPGEQRSASVGRLQLYARLSIAASATASRPAGPVDAVGGRDLRRGHKNHVAIVDLDADATRIDELPARIGADELERWGAARGVREPVALERRALGEWKPCVTLVLPVIDRDDESTRTATGCQRAPQMGDATANREIRRE